MFPYNEDDTDLSGVVDSERQPADSILRVAGWTGLGEVGHMGIDFDIFGAVKQAVQEEGKKAFTGYQGPQLPKIAGVAGGPKMPAWISGLAKPLVTIGTAVVKKVEAQKAAKQTPSEVQTTAAGEPRTPPQTAGVNWLFIGGAGAVALLAVMAMRRR